MPTSYMIEIGYASVHGTTMEELLELMREITEEGLLLRCKFLGIERLKPEYDNFEFYCKYHLKNYNVKEKGLWFGASGGGEHRRVSEFVIKTIFLLILEKAIHKDYNINFISS